MTDLPRGLYETLLTERLAQALDALDARLVVDRTDLRPAEASDRLALLVGRLVHRAVDALGDGDRVSEGVRLARALVAYLDGEVTRAGLAPDAPSQPGTVLRALRARRPDGSPETFEEPLIPLLDTTLLTNAPGEPRVGSQLKAEVQSADRIDVVMAFIRRTGIQPLLDVLRRHCDAGRPIRVLTTTYTGSTERKALDLLQDLGADVRVSYDTSTTRLHAKAWLFHRRSGFSTAYVGSSNLTHSAQVSGLEWNIRVSGARNPDVLDKIRAVFDAYWHGAEFVAYDAAQFDEETRRGEGAAARGVLLSPIELRPEPFQERLLEQIALARRQGHHRNLLVSATGTGKTVMAAVDYARLRSTLPRDRLLFVAHREEILQQSRATFCHAVRDASFGELWVGGKRPTRFDHVFASIQSLHAVGLRDLDPRHFDVVIVDEFHHAAAPSYRALLELVRPAELLGLTATPERSDGLPVLEWFDGRIAAELRLWDAIDQHRLVPFAYYGVHDGLDLRQVPWKRGRGYDVEGLSNLYTADDVWARRVLAELERRVDDVRSIRALAFCVDVAHARFMARVFREAGVAAEAIWGESPEAERRHALAELAAGRLQVVFSVDLFNEGVDVPTVDTLLLLRPTDSPTLFLQQLGRGLRRAHGKDVCTVLDFVGHHRREFRFDRRFRALLGGSRRDVVQQVEQGFPFLPAGCHLELDRIAQELVLENLRTAIPARWTAKADELRALATAGADLTLATYLDETGMELDDVYGGNRSWSDLREAAALPTRPRGPHEPSLRRACGRLLHVDDAERIEGFRGFLDAEGPPDVARLGTRRQRLLRMLVASVADQALTKSQTLAEAAALLWAHPQVRAELRELLGVLAHRVDHLHRPLETHPDIPLQIHARYTRLEILAACGVKPDRAKVGAWQQGVLHVDEVNADLLAFTLDKTEGQFSPTTRYRDYALSRELIHWESQSVTRADSETGARYRHHADRGSHILLFARLRQNERAFWFLGPAAYVSHEGELPMAITWRLAHPLPGDLFASFAAAVA